MRRERRQGSLQVAGWGFDMGLHDFDFIKELERANKRMAEIFEETEDAMRNGLNLRLLGISAKMKLMS